MHVTSIRGQLVILCTVYPYRPYHPGKKHNNRGGLRSPSVNLRVPPSTRQPFPLAHLTTRQRPRSFAARLHVRPLQGHPFTLAHRRAARGPFLEDRCVRRLIPEAGARTCPLKTRRRAPFPLPPRTPQQPRSTMSRSMGSRSLTRTEERPVIRTVEAHDKHVLARWAGRWPAPIEPRRRTVPRRPLCGCVLVSRADVHPRLLKSAHVRPPPPPPTPPAAREQMCSFQGGSRLPEPTEGRPSGRALQLTSMISCPRDSE